MNAMTKKQDEKRTARIEMRVTPAVKLEAEKKAYCAGLKLTEWIEKLIKDAQ